MTAKPTIESFAWDLAHARPDQCNKLNRAAIPCDRKSPHEGQHQGTEVGGGSVSWGDDEPAPTDAALAYVFGEASPHPPAAPHDALAALRRHLADGAEWPGGYTSEEVAKLGQGQPDGETWAWIEGARFAREALRLLDAAEGAPVPDEKHEVFAPVLDERTPALVAALAGQPLRVALDSIVAHLREPLEALLSAQRAFLISRGWTEVEPTGAKTFFTSPKLRSALRWKGPSARPGAKLQTMDTAVALEMILEREGSSAYREAIDFFLHEIRPPEKKGGKR